MDTEVVIVGAGVSGMSLALSLAKEGVEVCLIDKSQPDTSKDFYTGKTAALNLASQKILEDLGVWDAIKEFSSDFKNIYVWDHEGTSSVEFCCDEVGRNKLGAVVPNKAILAGILSQLSNYSNLQFLTGENLSDLHTKDDTIVLTTASGKTISSRLVVGADGGLSSVRSMSSIKIRTWSYEQKAIVGTLKSTKPHNNTAYQVFTKEGPVALLPLQKNGKEMLSLVWSADTSYADSILDLKTDDFLKELEIKTESVLGELSLEGELSSFPLHQLHARNYFGDRVVLVGDAAHSIHPLAGQGLNLGLGDVKQLSDGILRARRYGEDVGSKKILFTYSKSRKKVNLRMMGLMEVFKKGFGTSNPWMKLGRNIIFDVTKRSSEVRKRFIKEAAGII